MEVDGLNIGERAAQLKKDVESLLLHLSTIPEELAEPVEDFLTEAKISLNDAAEAADKIPNKTPLSPSGA